MGLEEKEDKKKWMKRKGRRREWSRVRNGLEEDKKEKRVERKKRGKNGLPMGRAGGGRGRREEDDLWAG